MRARPKEQPWDVTLGPFIGVRERVDPRVADPHYASSLTNVYPRPGDFTTLVRPGFQALGQPAVGEGQCVVHLSRPGTEQTWVVVGGQLYEYDWATETFANRTPAGIVMSATGRVYAVYFAQHLIFSDGANKPWMYDPDAHTGTVLDQTEGPWFGPPRVYYAKLFGIRADDRQTIEWSEEEQPNVGYEHPSANFNNVWTLGQTEQDALVALAATNTALFYFREGSIGVISGAVTPDFKTDGVHDGVSTVLGTRSPDAVYIVGNHLYFVDQNGRPQRLEYGGGALELWRDAAVTTARAQQGELEGGVWAARVSLATGDDEVPVMAAAIAMPVRQGSLETLDLLLFDEASGRFLGTWHHRTASAIDFACGCAARDPEGNATLLHLDSAGTLYRLKAPDDATVAVDSLAGGVTALPEASIESPIAGYDTRSEVLLDRIHVVAERGAAGQAMTVAVDYRTSRTVYPAQPLQLPLAAGEAESEVQGEVGTMGRGRWVIARLSNGKEPAQVRHGWREMTLLGTRIPTQTTTP